MKYYMLSSHITPFRLGCHNTPSQRYPVLLLLYLHLLLLRCKQTYLTCFFNASLRFIFIILLFTFQKQSQFLLYEDTYLIVILHEIVTPKRIYSYMIIC